ncbi:hypothetical protein niasHT_032233 [Heterodera trifolii]|uniref:Uncharacterized protein n=1 Tax=Heterodera trifolii TaxID=157864 RepID=A0ABD2IBC4_9BILA
MSAPSAAFFLFAFTLFVPTANALSCLQGSQIIQRGSYETVVCPSSAGCFKAACDGSDESTIRIKGCLEDDMLCGITYSKPNAVQCTLHCCTGHLCNGVLAMHTPAIGLAVLVPLIIGILAAAFGILY